MKEKLSKELITKLTKKDFNVGDEQSFLYKNNNNIWDITIRREEEMYAPFKFSLMAEKIGSNETFSRRYTEIEDAILHIVNDFNENANISNKYNSISEYLEETQVIKSKKESEEINQKRKFKAEKFVDLIKYYYGKGNIPKAYESWTNLYDLFKTTPNMTENERMETLSTLRSYTDKIENKIVYSITDYGKEKEYIRMGYIEPLKDSEEFEESKNEEDEL